MRAGGRHRCGLADLSLTPLLPAPWPLQLRKDRGVIIGGSQSTKAAAQRQLQREKERKSERERRGSQAAEKRRTMAPSPYRARGAEPTLNLLSGPFTKTVITLGFSRWLTQKAQLSTDSSVTRRHTLHTCTHAHTQAKNRRRGDPSS